MTNNISIPTNMAALLQINMDPLFAVYLQLVTEGATNLLGDLLASVYII